MAGSQESRADSVRIDDITLQALVEQALFISGDKPLTERQLAMGLGQARERIAGALAALAREYEKPERALKIQPVAGGYRLTTKPEHHDRVKPLLQTPKTRTEFSPAAMEALALIALKQPVTLIQINDIRGVNSEGVIDAPIFPPAPRMTMLPSVRRIESRSRALGAANRPSSSVWSQ